MMIFPHHKAPAGSLLVKIITTSVPACDGWGVNNVFNAVGSRKVPKPSSVLHVAEVASPAIVPLTLKSSFTHTMVLKPAVTIAAGSTVTTTLILLLHSHSTPFDVADGVIVYVTKPATLLGLLTHPQLQFRTVCSTSNPGEILETIPSYTLCQKHSLVN